MERLAIAPCMISMLATVSTVFGCGVLPARHVRNGNFTITGFTTLPCHGANYYGRSFHSAPWPGRTVTCPIRATSCNESSLQSPPRSGS
ncbi:hypothetical protein KIN20_020427 [Parelaphostrongylus tenuis]|uniref:Secreted protein n=1 Tax=Parelaphostrongylus tenuis TaxID=148309 RepID=A0AAD5QTH4_PARTN|nr:hypothetical protein KIN20_020427 [Parelaphostrongylus tenuis]